MTARRLQVPQKRHQWKSDCKVKYLTTGVKLFPKEWNGKVVNRLDCVILQERLDEMVKKIQLIINDMMKTGNINLDQIPSLLKILERDSISFMDFCKEKVKVRTYGLKDDTADRYERFMKFFRKWGEIVWFSDLTEKNILLMDAELAKKNMKAKSKWHNYHIPNNYGGFEQFAEYISVGLVERGHEVTVYSPHYCYLM